MTSFEQLKQQVESLNSNNSPLTKLQREIFFYEQDLIRSSICFDFSALLSDLDPENASKTFGPHNYTRQNYQLNWHKRDKNYQLSITNVLANKTVNLKECPSHLQEITIGLLNPFIELMAQNFKGNCEYDESYSLDS